MDPSDAVFPIGETAAVTAATFWAAGSLLFASASRRAGPWAVNQFRLFAATPLLGLAFLAQGWSSGFEDAPPARQTVLLLVSGVVGLVLGDAALFKAWTILGARRVALLGSLAPVMAAVLAAPLLGERLGPFGIGGMAVTIAGILWVVAERAQGGEPIHGRPAAGVAMGVLAALGQAAGAVLTKAGLGLAAADTPLGAFVAAGGEAPRHLSPLLAVMIRMTVACVALALFTIPTGRHRQLRLLAADRGTLARASTAMLLGTVFGVWLSIVSFAHTETGVAQTLLSLTPVLVLPMARFATQDRPSPRAWVGAVVVVLGVALLALRQRHG